MLAQGRRLQKLILLVSGLLSACSMAPQYQKPLVSHATHYKEAGRWVQVKPSINTVGKEEPWWMMYQDKTLNALEKKVSCDNNNLKIAYARYQEAREIARVARSAKYPTILGLANATRVHNSDTIINTPKTNRLLYNSFLWSALVSYEVDLWGRIHNAVVANDALARASHFDLVAVSLSLHAELAVDYFELRRTDTTQALLDQAVLVYGKSLRLVRQRHQGGLVSEEAVDQALTYYENAKTMATENRLKRSQLEHAMAVLAGETPATFNVKPRKKAFHLVTISPDLPSTLLQRRPDIAAAEQRVESANANIGVARAAFFPTFNLFTTLGGQSSQFPDLFSAKSIFWAIGPTAGTTIVSLVQPMTTWVLFDGFKLQALLSKAKAELYESAAAYRQTSLTAFQEVEDKLVAIHRLDQAIQTQSSSLLGATRALHQANRRWKGGIATYLEVAPVQAEMIESQLALVSLRTRRQLASVELIKALGGGWHCPRHKT